MTVVLLIFGTCVFLLFVFCVCDLSIYHFNYDKKITQCLVIRFKFYYSTHAGKEACKLCVGENQNEERKLAHSVQQPANSTVSTAT